jgi:predicted RNA methylase
MNEIIQSVLFDKNNFTVKKAVKWLKTRNLKYNDVDNDKPNYIHFRQEDPKKLENEGYLFKNKVFDNGTKIYIIAYKNGLKGGAISSENLEKFIKASYKSTDDDIDGYKKDKELSTAEISTFYNPSNDHVVAVFRGTEKTLTDWSNNIAYVVGQYENTDRFKRAKELYNKIVKKYGEKNISLVGHSQSAVITRKIGENAKEIINVNPAHLFEKQKENEFNVRSSGDIVSAVKPVADVYNKVKTTATNAVKSVANVFLPKSKKLKIDKDVSNQNITIENKTLNPLTEHTSDILNRLPSETLIGQGMKPLFNNYIVEVPTPMINKTNKGRLVEVNPITKTGNLTTRNKKKSVVIRISPDDEPHIQEHGDLINKGLEEMKKKKIKKMREVYKKFTNKPENKKLRDEHFNLKNSIEEIENKIILLKGNSKEKRELKIKLQKLKDRRMEIKPEYDKIFEEAEKLKTIVEFTKMDIKDDKTLKEFNSIYLQIPKMANVTKNNKVVEISPITKTGNLTTRNKQKSIILKPSKDNEIHFETKQNKPVVIPEVKKTFEKNKWIELENSDSESDSDGEIEIWRNGKLVKPVEDSESDSESDEEDDDKLKLNNKQEEVIKGIDELLKFLKTGRKNFYIEKNQELFETLRNAIMAYDFYPTPEKYSEEIYKLETEHYGLNNSHILDVGCGLLSLSLPFIQNAVETTKIDLIEMNPAFYNIIKPLQGNNINIINKNFFDIPTETFNKKGINIILSNPPFAGTAGGDRTTLLYYYFLKKILDIAMIQNTETHIYFICPKTHFQSKNKWMKNGDVIDVSNVIPKKTEKDINKFLNIKWMMDNEFNGQCEYLHDITSFRTLRKGKPVDLGLTVGLFRFSVRSGWGG